MRIIMLNTINFLSFFMIFVIHINKCLTTKEATTVKTTTVKSTTFTPIDFAKERDEIVNNVKTQFKALKNLSSEVQSIFANETNEARKIYNQVADTVGWYLHQPSDNDTADLDRALAKFYPFGGSVDDYIDTDEKMDEFCNTRVKVLDDLKMWIRRKHNYNVVLQIPFNMVIDQIDSKTNYFCNTTEHKSNYIKKIKKVKAINTELVDVKEKLMDNAIYVQNSSFITRIPKLGRVCCSFWEFSKTISKNIKDPETVAFVNSITSAYFAAGTKYLCYFHPYGSSVCEEEVKEKTPKYPHKFNSILMEMIILLSEMI